MKNILIVLLITLASVTTYGQEVVNLKNGFAAEGYDVVSYFQDSPTKGDKKYVTTHNGVKYRFHSSDNLETFQDNPEKYIPQYGGFCAYAVGKDGKKVGVDPKTFVITDEKLYLFYNSWGVNTLEKWKKEGAEALQKEADKNWLTLKDIH